MLVSLKSEKRHITDADSLELTQLDFSRLASRGRFDSSKVPPQLSQQQVWSNLKKLNLSMNIKIIRQ
jgi:hypothetical protein